MSTDPNNSNGLAGRRVLVVGEALSALQAGPLQGAAVETGDLSQLAMPRLSGCDLVVIDANAWPPEPLSAALQSLSSDPKTPPVLLVGTHMPTGVVRNLMRLERSDVIEAPFTQEKFATAIAGLLTAPSQAVAAPGGHQSRCWAVTAAVGGAGATTVAIEIANALCARATRDKSVCLIDLNLADGAAAAYLGATPTMRLADLGDTAERIDVSMLQAFVTPLTAKLDLFAAPRDPDAFAAVSREAVLRTLEAACETYDWVIVDFPRHRHPWTLEALSGCDEILVISELTVPALIAARSLSDEIDRRLDGANKPRIVLNRLASRMFGPAPSMAEAERALQRKAEAGISSDWDAAAASVNLGGPIATHRPKSKIVTDVNRLVDRLAGAAPVAKVKSRKAA